jgi:hypothetical protein
VRSGLRQHWHVYGVIRDTSPDAFTPTLGYATKVVSVTVIVFFALIGFIFWLASLSHRAVVEIAPAPAPAPLHPAGSEPGAVRAAGFEAASGPTESPS